MFGEQMAVGQMRDIRWDPNAFLELLLEHHFNFHVAETSGRIGVTLGTVTFSLRRVDGGSDVFTPPGGRLPATHLLVISDRAKASIRSR